jgi:hypothetical protein
MTRQELATFKKIARCLTAECINVEEAMNREERDKSTQEEDTNISKELIRINTFALHLTPTYHDRQRTNQSAS